MRILYFITNLTTGGAEIQLYNVVKKLRIDHEIEVISMLTAGDIGHKIEKLDIPLHVLNLHKLRSIFRAIVLVLNVFIKLKPDVVHTWMYHSNLFGGIVAKLFRIKKIIWSIHHNDLSLQHNKFSTIIVAKIGALVSYFIPAKIICVSSKVIDIHSRFGYFKKKMVYIPNGIDLNLFYSIPNARISFIKEFNLRKETKLIGCIGRFDQIKNHKIFLESVAKLCQRDADIKIILCGKNINKSNVQLLNLIDENHLTDIVLLLGLQKNVPVLFSALDMIVNASFNESFSLVLAEALACRTLCVSTIGGDPERFLEPSQHIKNPKSSSEMARVIARNLDLSANVKNELKQTGLNKIIKDYSLDKLTENYLKIY